MNKYNFEIYKNSINNQKFTLIFIFSIFLSAFGIINIATGYNYVNGFISIITNGYYIAILLLLILINTCNIYYEFSDNIFYIIRLKDKKNFLKELIKIVCTSNFVLLIINLILIMIGLNLFNHHIFEINNFVYLIYIIIKLIILTQFISILNILLFKLVNNKVVILLNIIIYILTIASNISMKPIKTIFQMPLFIGAYFKIQPYANFLFEILCFILFSSIIYILVLFLKKIVLKYMKGVIS